MRNIIGIIILFILYVIFVISSETIVADSSYPDLNKNRFKSSLSMLNQAVTMGIAKNKISPATCKGCKNSKLALAKHFYEYMPIMRKKYILDKTCLNTPGGMKYHFVKADGTCGESDSWDPETANCVILVDVNGDKMPNRLYKGNDLSNINNYDRFNFIILKDKVVPANENKELLLN